MRDERRELPARELQLRLALLRLHEGNPRPLRRVLAQLSSLSAAVMELPRQTPEVRVLLAPLCEQNLLAGALSPLDEHFLGRDDGVVLPHDDERFPALLAEISEPPPLLFCRGDITALLPPQIAIVGSRNASPAGLATARAFAADLAAAGFVITSGMALGIDAMAHEGALAAGGRTVAVLGCGADQIYPRRHARLAADIRAQGCIVSEFLPGTPPLAPHFPLRNRIISGLSLGVLVVEAAPDSGSLITARFAAEQGREVFAIPGSIHSPLARGCHQLIREGATLIETSAQLVDALSHFAILRTDGEATTHGSAGSAVALSPDEQRVMAVLSAAGNGIDELVLRSGMPAATVGALLTGLALRGQVHSLAGGLWQPASTATGEARC